MVYRRTGQSQLIEHSGEPMPRAAVTAAPAPLDPLTLITGALDTLFFGEGRTLRVIGVVRGDTTLVEVLVPQNGLRAEMLVYSRTPFISCSSWR